MRKAIYRMISTTENGRFGTVYSGIMILTILASLLPLAFKETNEIFYYIEYISVCIFILDYFLRWLTADYKLHNRFWSFLRYPFTPMAIIDLLSVLPSLSILHSGFRLFKLFRLMRSLRVLRALKFLRYSKSFETVSNVFRKQKKVLIAVASLAVAYVLVSALVIYNVEPDSFATFFDAVYWATISLTTVGYGDIYPITTVGRVVTMVSSIFGIAVIALPSGVITAGYMEEIAAQNRENDENAEK